MKLGVTGLVPGDPRKIDEATVAKIKSWGFVGATVYFTEDHGGIDSGLCSHIRTLFANTGVDLVQLGAWMAPLIDRDPGQAAWSERQRREAIRVASAMGCRCVSFGSGTLSPRGGGGFGGPRGKAWFPDKENWGQEAFDVVVQRLKETAQVAEDHGVYIALECHLYSVLSSPERTKQVVDAVGSPYVKVTIDPANWITPLNYFDSAGAIRHMFARLGDAIMNAHAKDVKLEDDLNIHMRDAYVGDGGLDFVTFVRSFNELHPDGYMIIEHTPVDLIPKARENLIAAAKSAGVELA